MSFLPDIIFKSTALIPQLSGMKLKCSVHVEFSTDLALNPDIVISGTRASL